MWENDTCVCVCDDCLQQGSTNFPKTYETMSKFEIPEGRRSASSQPVTEMNTRNISWEGFL